MFFQRPRFIRMSVFLVAALILVAGVFFPSQHMPARAATTSGPTISLSRQTIAPGNQLTAIGQGLAAQTNFQLVLIDTTGTQKNLTYPYSDANGNFSINFTFPQDESILQGSYTVSLYPSDSSTGTPIAQTSLEVVPAIFQTTGNAGLPVTVTGAGFSSNETINVSFNNNNTEIAEGTAKSDAFGNITDTFTMPAGLADGRYAVSFLRTGLKPAVIRGTIRIYPLAIIAPGGAKSGGGISVRGTGFVPNETVTLSWNANGGAELYQANADDTGGIYFGVNLPATPLGVYTMTAVGSSSGFSASTSITIGAGISLYAQYRQPGQGNPGGQITVYGGGFNPNEQVDVYFQTKTNGVTTTTTDSYGSFSVNITVPMYYSTSTTYYVHAQNVAGTISTRAKFMYITPTVWLSSRFPTDPSSTSVFVDGFGANETVQIVDRYQQAGQVVVGTLTTDATGFGGMGITWISTPHTSQVPFAAIGQISNLTATGTHTDDPVFLTNTSDLTYVVGNAGDTVQFNGKNFAASEQINITFNDKVVFTCTSNPDGSFAAPVVIPPLANVSSGAGDVRVKAVGVSSGLIGGGSYPDMVTFYYQPTLTITPTTGPSGTIITVTGTNFPANANVMIGWDGPFPYNPQLSGYPTGTYAAPNADQNGNLTQTIQANDLVSGQMYHVAVLNYYGPAFNASATFVAQ